MEFILQESTEFEVFRYDASKREEWDVFVAASSSGTFLHTRKFLEYHGDRFVDTSIMIYQEKKGLVAVFPSAQGSISGEVISHPGITFGGLLHTGELDLQEFLDIFAAMCMYFRNAGFKRLIYKTVPYIYHRNFNDHDLYALWRSSSIVISRSPSSTLIPSLARPFSDRKKRMIRKILQEITIETNSTEYHAFWEILTANLQSKYSRVPVHNIGEITKLKDTFPAEISLNVAKYSDEVLGGIVCFKSNNVIHIQYIASNEQGRKLGVIDKLVSSLMSSNPNAIIDFGISSEDSGKFLNKDLQRFKHEFGSGVVNYDVYEVPLR